MRDHGGDPDRARARWGEGDWLDLSTGINPVPYPLPPLPEAAWTALPTATALRGLGDAARLAYATPLDAVPVAGAQAAIQIVPRLAPPGRAAVLSPTYNEHAGALSSQGWQVAAAEDADALRGADIAIVVNPNNPDGRVTAGDTLLRLAGTVGLLVVDESFADATPGVSVAGRSDLPGNVLILRSFGKFYGLAGLRLGFALARPDLAARVGTLAGPWAVGGPAIAVGCAALADDAWRRRTLDRLAADADRLDRLAARAGWRLVGGTPLFRTYATGDAAAAQDRLARARIWSRIFPYSDRWLRLGLPGTDDGWRRLEDALTPPSR